MATANRGSRVLSRLPFPRSRRSRAVLAVAVLIAGSLAYWYNENRTIGWGQTLNPFYWYARAHGYDLFDEQGAILMHGNRGRDEVALTFDDGPHQESRSKILATLKQFGANATFFDIGLRSVERPDLVRQTLVDGNEIGNHSYHHYRLDTLAPAAMHREVNDVDTAYFRITGRHLVLLRPPGMRYNDQVLRQTTQLGYIIVGYTNASRDYDLAESPNFIAQRTLRRTESGSIILLHDYPNTAQALPTILTSLRNRGLHCVTISTMLEHLPTRQQQLVSEFLRRHNQPALSVPHLGLAYKE